MYLYNPSQCDGMPVARKHNDGDWIIELEDMTEEEFRRAVRDVPSLGELILRTECGESVAKPDATVSISWNRAHPPKRIMDAVDRGDVEFVNDSD